MNFPLSSSFLKSGFFSYRQPAVTLSMLKVCSLWRSDSSSKLYGWILTLSTYRKGAEGVCYTVTIRGEEKRLFLEWMDSTFASRVARWYVETMASDAG